MDLLERFAKMQGAMSKLLLDGTHTDFTIALKGGATMNTHRCIVGARCEVAAGVLRAGERAPGGDVLNIDDIAPELGRAIVWFMYTGVLDAAPGGRSPPDFAILAVAADKYKVAGLETACAAALRDALEADPDAVWDVLTAARVHAAQIVRTCLEVVAGMGNSATAAASLAAAAPALSSPLMGAVTAALVGGRVDARFTVDTVAGDGDPPNKRRRW